MRLLYITPLLAAAGAAAWIAVAPPASAGTDQLSCTSAGTYSECQSPGNVQINDSRPVQFGPQYPYWEGDYFGGFHTDRGHR